MPAADPGPGVTAPPVATTPPPRLAPEALADARARAMVARRLRADVKRRLRTAETSPSEMLDLAFADTELGRAVARMTVGDLLLSLPGTGRVLADRLLVDVGISGNRRLRALGEHQRAALRASWSGAARASADGPDVPGDGVSR